MIKIHTVFSRALATCKAFSILYLFSALLGCSSPISITKPINISTPDQTVSAEFEVKELGGYRFALLFAWGDDKSKMDAQSKLWGVWGENNGGTPIPIHLRITRDDKIFFNELILTRGTNSTFSFDYDGARKSVQLRDIKHITLPPGRYLVEVSTTETTEAFSKTETYVKFSYYNPKI